MNSYMETRYALLLGQQHKEDYTPCITDPKLVFEWAGNSQAWFLIEIILMSVYILTMVFLMAKSKFIKVGVDQTQQFEPIYLSKMINKIVNSMDFDLLQEERSFCKTKQKYTRTRNVQVDGVSIKCKMTEEAFTKAFNKTVLGELEIIPPNEARFWLQENVLGDITKEKLES